MRTNLSLYELWRERRANWKPHLGRHHYAPCGEWRPVSPTDECPRCDAKCPCGREKGGAWG